MYSRIFIAKDQSKEEREKEKNLRLELKELRETEVEWYTKKKRKIVKESEARGRITMKLEHTKSGESPIRGCTVAQQVHLLSQLRVLVLMGTRSLPTPGLCQPRSSLEP